MVTYNSLVCTSSFLITATPLTPLQILSLLNIMNQMVPGSVNPREDSKVKRI